MKVYKITEDFDNYLKKIHGMNDIKRAREMEHRDDRFGQMYDNARNEIGESMSRQSEARSAFDFGMRADQRGSSYNRGRASRFLFSPMAHPHAFTGGPLQPSTSPGFDDSGRVGQASSVMRPRQFDMYDNDSYRKINSSSARTSSTFGRDSDRTLSGGIPYRNDFRSPSDFGSE